MNSKFIKHLSVTIILFASTSLAAQTLEGVITKDTLKTQAGTASQKRVVALDEETQKLLDKYRALNRKTETTRGYNRQIQELVDEQDKEITQLEETYNQIADMERDVGPMIEQMIVSIGTFIREVDAPFHMKERQRKLAKVERNFALPSYDMVAKFQQTMDLWKDELEYGRTSDAYADTLKIDNEELEVDILRIGRVALLYRTADKKRFGRWDYGSRKWVPLDPGEYQAILSEGIRVINKNAPMGLVALPVALGGGAK